MCGICACVARSDESASATVRDLAARLAHRGPGERGFATHQGVALGIARLHVVARDAPTGPYVTADGAAAAVVNGEIWNHDDLRRDLAARGIAVPAGPDTAIVAPLYAADGVAAFAKLRGMFAIVIHDRRDGSVVLARDRFGIKPLHYTRNPGARGGHELVVASEAGPLALAAMRDPARADRLAVADYLALGYVPSPATLVADVRQVPAGSALTFRAGGVDESRFAPLPEIEPARTVDVPALARALDRSVRRHLMGDLAFGVFLSGGVDSSVLAALVARTGAPFRAFALTFPGEGAFDEAPAARATAAHLGVPLDETPLAAADVPKLLDEVVRAHGGPFADSSALATHALCRRAADGGVGVVLSGTGADELFAGYRRYRVGRLPGVVAAAARAAAAVLPRSRRTRLGTLGALARKAARASGPGGAERYLEWHSVVPAAWRARLLRTGDAAPVLLRFRAAFESNAAPADGARAADLATYLRDDVLAKEDRAAAAVSMENRVPYLDDEVADLAGSAPASAHVGATSAGGRAFRGAKASLRAAGAELLPDAVLNRPKQGFGVPISEWMRGPLRSLVDAHLADSSAAVRTVLDSAAVGELVAAHRRGDDDLGSAVWALVVLEASMRSRA